MTRKKALRFVYDVPLHLGLKTIISQNKLNLFAYFFILFSFFIRLWSLSAHDLIREEAYYWNYSTHLDFGYLDHPPMVALLIAIGTKLFGTNEFAVRITSLLCWLGTVYFSHQLSERIQRGSGIYAALLLSLLPFFFIHSIVMTPDQPLVLCWSAALYCLYMAFKMDKPLYLYGAAVWIGLGMLSKYTIILLALPCLAYCASNPRMRIWFKRKETYLSILIALLIFSPVIYWNATHEWASFVFQGPTRFRTVYRFSFHHFLGLLVLFLSPLGLIHAGYLFKKQEQIHQDDQRFLQLFACLPLVFFGLYSIQHPIKFNWIGPSLLALVPWLAVLIRKAKPSVYKIWQLNFIGMLVLLVTVLSVMTFNYPKIVYQPFAHKLIDWEDLTHQVEHIIQQADNKSSSPPFIMALDTYNIISELAFYQAKIHSKTKSSLIYPVLGQHIFQRISLMYSYWSPQQNLSHKKLLLLSEYPEYFNAPDITNIVHFKSPILSFWSHSQHNHQEVKRFYYVIGEIA